MFSDLSLELDYRTLSIGKREALWSAWLEDRYDYAVKIRNSYVAFIFQGSLDVVRKLTKKKTGGP